VTRLDDVRHSWSESERFVPRTFVRPALRFMQIETSSAVVMLVCAAVALVWANSPWAGGYTAFWSTPVSLSAGPFHALDGLTLRDWVNDGAMTVFFLVVALEIKRELVSGQLRDRRAAALPVLAALGGMAVPALIYLAFNAGTPAARGWGVPMATDIAFAVAVVTLASRRVPPGAKLLLLTLAIADDLGAIAVIAVFYTDGLSLPWLGVAVAAVVAAVALRRLDVRSVLPYVVLGVGCWLCLHESGVHTTIAGVAFGFVTPTWSLYDPAHFGRRARGLVAGIEGAFSDGRLSLGEYERVQAQLRDITRLATETAAPLDRLVHRLTPWVGFLVLPVFAVANAGLTLGGVEGWSTDSVLLGVAVGLLLGKTVGVFGAVWLTCRFTSVRLPPATTWRHVLGLSLCAGVGFTVALFVSDLSSTDPAMVLSAKTGVLAGSLLAGVVGYLVLRTAPEMRCTGLGPSTSVPRVPDRG
jgi:NhaA family Na+:H+ antiporter